MKETLMFLGVFFILISISKAIWALILRRSYKQKAETNADRIRNLSVEELARFIVDEACLHCDQYQTEKCYQECINAQIEWLEQPVEE